MLDQQLDNEQPTAVQLVERIGDGDTSAEALLVQLYQRPLLEMLKYRSNDPELARDLLQDTFVVVIVRLRERRLEQPDKLIAFMHRTAHNLVIAHFRKESRRATAANTDIVEVRIDDKPTSLDIVLSQEKGNLVRQLLQELGQKRDREVLERFYVLGQDKSVVCNALELSAIQFDHVVSRARKRFKNLMESRLSEKL